MHPRTVLRSVVPVILLGALAVASPAIGQGSAAVRWVPRLMGALGLGVATNVVSDWIKQGWAATDAEEKAARAEYERGLRAMQRVPPEWPQALEAFRKADRLGHPAASFFIARAYYRGDGVKRDPALAARWVRKAADRGYPPAMDALAWQYDRGDGVREDPIEAVIWAQRAAEAGYASAQLRLAHFRYQGRGAPQDHREALRWLQRAAEAGNAEAEYGMGWVSEHGDMGVQRDLKLAAAWYRRAANRGHGAARQRLQRLPG